MGQDDPLMAKGLAFQMTDDGKTLQAVFTPLEPKQPIDIALIKSALANQGLDALFLIEHALTELVRKYNTTTEPFTLNIGERRDGTITVTVVPDKMTASLTITPPCGGQAVDRQQVLDALKAAGVVSGILLEEIDTDIALGQAEKKPIAQGRLPVHGRDAEFRAVIAEIRGRHPKIDARGICDYRELDQFVMVKKGELLMRRIPATPGVAGENVLGTAIPSKTGKDPSFAPGLKGALVHPKDRNLLTAEIPGHAVLVQNGVMVEPVLTVQDVDLSSGNLEFEGAIHVVKDVKIGMKIKATGDVIVGGMMEASEIEAGGNVSVRGGVLGHVEISDHGGATHPASARIRCGGSLTAHFIENASVEAGDCIIVDEEVKRSALTAVNQVVVGKKGARKGHLIGGTTQATMLVQAIIIGSHAGIDTKIEVGVNPLIHSKLNALVLQLQHLEKEREDIARVIAYTLEHPTRINPDIMHKAELTYDKLQADITELTQEKESLQTQMKLADSARVIVGQRMYSGVEVNIGDKMRLIDEERIGGVFCLRDNDIFINDT